MEKKGNHIHDKPQVAEVRKYVRVLFFFVKVRELISETSGVVFCNSGSFTFSVRLVLKTTPGGGAVW